MTTVADRASLLYFAEELVGLELRPGQRQVVDLLDHEFERLRTVLIRKGRRAGMTTCAALIAAWCGTVKAEKFREHVLPGEDFEITLVATSRDQAGIMLHSVKRFLKASPMLASEIVAENGDSITLETGCVISAIPCSARASRGRANGVVVMDEAAHFVDSQGNASLRAVQDALLPPLAQFGDLGLMLVISTPLDASGAFYELEQQAASGQFEDMAALHLPTHEAMPQFARGAERERARNPLRFQREFLGEYTTGEEGFPIEAFDACVDPDYRRPYDDPGRVVIFALDGAVSRDAMALVGVDVDWNLVYSRAWHPSKGGVIDHETVLEELRDLARRFYIAAVAFDPAQIHMLVTEALREGLPMLPVSQAAGRGGGTMAHHTATLLEAFHERRLRLYPDPELREHVARARLSARSGAERIVKARSSDKIDLAVALAMAVGTRAKLELQALLNPEPQVEYELVDLRELAGITPTQLNWCDPLPDPDYNDWGGISLGPPLRWEHPYWEE